MKKAGKIFIWASLAAIVLWIVPWLYNLVSLKGYHSPFTLYSCTVHDFCALDRGDGREFKFYDTKGGVHGEEAQPLFYASVLASKGMLPDTLEGRKVTLEEIEHNSLIISSDPKDVNRTSAPVYLLLESVPERLELKDPEDALISRKDGICVYNMESNSLLEEKTAQLKEALDKEGFTYPAKLFAGNPSHRKEYDEGYLVTDSDDRLFQIKQVNGILEVRSFPLADNIHAKHLIITEFDNHATLGLLVSGEGKMAFLRPDGEVVLTEVPFNPAKEDLLLVGDIFYYTVKLSDSKGERFWALRSDDFSLVSSYERPYPDEFTLPGIRFTSGNDRWVKPRWR